MSPYRGMSSQSPHSSSGKADSPDGTPDTSLTAFSPEDSRPSRMPDTSLSGGASIGAGQHDPFITTGQQSTRTLSATATSFRPLRLNGNSSSSTHSAIPPPSIGSPTQFGTFSTDTAASRCLKISGIYGDTEVPALVTASLNNLEHRGIELTGLKSVRVNINTVYIRHTDINDAAEVYTVIKLENPILAIEYISPQALGHAVSPKSKLYSAHEGQIVLTVTYPADAALDKKVFEDAVRNALQTEGKLLAWQKISATEAGTFRMLAEFCDTLKAQKVVKRLHGRYCKELGVTLDLQLHQPDLVSQRVTLPAATPTRRPGDQSSLDEAMGRMSLSDPRQQYFHADTESSRSSVPTYAGSTGGPFPLTPNGSAMSMGYFGGIGGMGNFFASSNIPPYLMGYSPGVHSPPPTAGTPLGAFGHSTFGQNGYGQRPFGHGNFPHSPYNSEQSYYGPGRSSSRMSPQYDRPSARRQNAIKIPHRGRVSNQVAAHHNHVDINRIQQGVDVRTTVMLRNIPNKLDQPQLRSIIDESSFGKYDFMYLRIDFSNNCNVGYAFINFSDPLDIIDFVRTRSGEKWHRFKSDKVAEVSYATIQGKDCLVQKFRNSSVMLEPPHYRPKLYHTFTDPFNRVGEEEPFPESDNASKLKRSCENAEHVGLFAPSAGQHMRDEQRRRRSQYDRGTSLAEREEYGYEGYEGGFDELDFNAMSPYGYAPY